MHIETFCPQCNARLHVDNFSVVIREDDKEYAGLNISCWQCTWATYFKIKRFDSVEED